MANTATRTTYTATNSGSLYRDNTVGSRRQHHHCHHQETILFVTNCHRLLVLLGPHLQQVKIVSDSNSSSSSSSTVIMIKDKVSNNRSNNHHINSVIISSMEDLQEAESSIFHRSSEDSIQLQSINDSLTGIHMLRWHILQESETNKTVILMCKHIRLNHKHNHNEHHRFILIK